MQKIKKFNKLKQIVENKGFIASKNSRSDIYQFFASHEGETSSGDIHIYLVIKNTERYKEFIIIRDYLLSNKEEVKNYSNYKRKLIKENITERKEYKAIKAKYVTDLIERAKKHIKYN